MSIDNKATLFRETKIFLCLIFWNGRIEEMKGTRLACDAKLLAEVLYRFGIREIASNIIIKNFRSTMSCDFRLNKSAAENAEIGSTLRLESNFWLPKWVQNRAIEF